MATLRRRVERILALGWEGAGEEPPRLWPGDRRQIARRAREAAFVALGRDPRGPGDIARGLGIRLHCLPGAGCGGEVSDASRVIFRWSDDTLVRRWRVAHGLGHALLITERHDHTETDALLLTIDLA